MRYPKILFIAINTILILLLYSITSTAQNNSVIATGNSYQIDVKDFREKKITIFFEDQLQNYPNYDLYEFSLFYVEPRMDPIELTINNKQMKEKLPIQYRANKGTYLHIYSIKVRNKQTGRIVQLDKAQHYFSIFLI